MTVFQANKIGGQSSTPRGEVPQHDALRCERSRANTPHDVKSLDGLRAVAALSVLFYHTFDVTHRHKMLLGVDVQAAWSYTQTGVHLFFVLSGFLLFLPFARAILHGKPLPSTRAFYRRRAFRILPAYWVCLVVLALAQWRQFASLVGLADIASHVVMLHDFVPDFNRAVEGPFWTLALEAQFYVVLPLAAWVIARIVGGSRASWRLCAAVIGLIVLALLIRDLDALGQQNLAHLHGVAAALVTTFVTLTLGSQGKFLEVFGVGMLGASLYVALGEGHGADSRWVRVAGWALIVTAVTLVVALAPPVMRLALEAPNHTLFTDPGDLAVVCGPFLIGLSYGALLLGILWAGPPARAPLEWNPLVFVGLMSYSLYLWHLPIATATISVFRLMPIPLRVVGAFVVAYLSYRLMEVPFLRRRGTSPTKPAMEQSAPSVWGSRKAVARRIRGRRAARPSARWKGGRYGHVLKSHFRVISHAWRELKASGWR